MVTSSKSLILKPISKHLSRNKGVVISLELFEVF